MDSALYQARSVGVGSNSELSFDLDAVAVQRVNPTMQAGRRNELVIICLVVVFSVLLLATIVLVACLVHRRGARTWFMGRSNGSNADVPSSYAKETMSPKPNLTGRMSAEPWLDENSHQDQTDLALDTKFEACKSAQYDQPNDMKYLGRENLMTGATYPIPTAGYLPQSNAVKLFTSPVSSGSMADGQTMPLTAHMAPMRFRPLHSPPADYMTNALDMHGAMVMPRSQPSAEISDLLTQSSYKPPSPDYQSLDVMWHRIPRPDLGSTNHRMGRYRNPVTTLTTAYAMGHGNATTYNNGGHDVVLPRPDRGLLFSPVTNEMLCTSDTAHTYYEITGAHQTQSVPKQAHAISHRPGDINGMDVGNRDVLEDWAGTRACSEMGQKSFTSAATLGRPATGKGKRRAATKGDSMYNPKAGELALHSSKKRSVTTSETNRDPGRAEMGDAELQNTKSNLDTDISTYGTKPSGQYTYQAYREGTFV
ncbi:unnamed protein product [Echinostoma caproni]|uniref:Uncharacterized protein n=1 Tax=Echinostoma caproni TaxID=27848 RepID=A0A183AJ75_9TREM|nr:unnamed protein product [Echinostoma caproni]